MNQAKKNPSNDDERFYRELDEKKSHGSCCTCQTFAIFFIILALILGGTTFYLYWQITHGGILTNKSNTSLTAQTTQDKIKNIHPDAFGEFQLVLSSEDMTNLLSEGISLNNLVMKDVYVLVNPNNIIVYGTLTKPLSSKMAIELVPKAQNGQIQFVVQKITAGNLAIPSFMVSSLSNNFSNLVNAKFNSLYNNYEITRVTLVENQMEIFGKLK
jgi:uncharacterized protein YpmS